MVNRILYREEIGEDIIEFKIDGGIVTEREKKSGKWFAERIIDAAECGSRIASRRTYKENEGRWYLRGQILENLFDGMGDKNPTYWGCLLAQRIHKMVAPRHEIIDYRTLSQDPEWRGSWTQRQAVL